MERDFKRYYLIDHRILFLFGYLFYLFTPYLIGVSDSFQGFPGMDLYQGFFRLIPQDRLNLYMLITLSWLPAFYLGHLSFKLLKPYKKQLRLYPATGASHGVSYVGLALIFVLALFAFLGRGSLFGGYGSYDISARGKMSTLLVIFNFFVLYQLITAQKLSFLLLAGMSITAFLLLSMGGRLYVFQTFVILLIYKTSFAPRRWKLYQIIGISLLGLLIGSTAGLWRMGASFGLNKAAYSLLAEPVFTWFSTSTFLISNQIPAFNIPMNFITSFFNLIPNTIVSLKPYIVSTQGMGYTFQNPLGAESVWTTYIINFGVAGSFLFIFLVGFLLNFLRHMSENSRFAAVYYILVCSILPFQFFRDGFYIINKQLFFNFLLLPALVLFLLKCLVFIGAAAQKEPIAMKHLPQVADNA